MNEVDADNETDFAASPPMATTIALLSLFHFFCCGIPLLLLSSVSLATLFSSWPIVGGVLALPGIGSFVWYLKKGCSSRPGNGEQGCPRGGQG